MDEHDPGTHRHVARISYTAKGSSLVETRSDHSTRFLSIYHLHRPNRSCRNTPPTPQSPSLSPSSSASWFVTVILHKKNGGRTAHFRFLTKNKHKSLFFCAARTDTLDTITKNAIHSRSRGCGGRHVPQLLRNYRWSHRTHLRDTVWL